MNAASGAISLPGAPTIGRFRIEQTLGVGSMGTVYLAQDPLLHRRVAIKTLSIHLAPTEARAYEDSFLNEARAVARLNHPNIVTVYDAGRAGGVPYIAMECLEGVELKQLLARAERMPMREFIELFMRVADALDYAHRHGIVHRDVKPANIFITSKSVPKVLDFGIAQAATLGVTATQRARGALVGTPNYMSPELIQGRPLDGRSDVFSLGVVMYEVLTGRLPFSGRTLDELTQNIVNATVAPPQTLNADVPIEIAAIVARALAKLPEQRYPDARTLADDLRRQLERMDVQRLVTRVGMLQPTDATRRPHRNFRWVAVLLGMTLAGIGWWQFGAHDTPVTPEPTTRQEAPAANAPLAAAGSTASGIAAPAVPGEAAPDDSAPTALLPPATASGTDGAGSASAASAPSSALVAPATASAPASPPAAALPAPPAATSTAPTASAARPARPAPPPARPAARDLPPPAPAVLAGTLAIAVSPWGEVIVNGQSRGITPPLSSIKLPPGNYNIEIRNGDFPTYFTSAEVQPNGTTRIRHKF